MAHKQHFEIYIQAHFSAAHHLRGYPGNCMKPHGHNWVVDVHVECTKLNELGIGIDFRDVKAVVKNVLEELDHSDLNEIPAFQDQNPSSENIAQYLYHKLATMLKASNAHVMKLCVSETPNCGVWYWED